MGRLLDLVCESLESRPDRIEGGRADSRQPSDFNREALLKGIKIEMEHTDDPDVALEIAMDHLAEFPNYYDEARGLPAMERDLKGSIEWEV